MKWCVLSVVLFFTIDPSGLVACDSSNSPEATSSSNTNQDVINTSRISGRWQLEPNGGEVLEFDNGFLRSETGGRIYSGQYSFDGRTFAFVYNKCEGQLPSGGSYDCTATLPSPPRRVELTVVSYTDSELVLQSKVLPGSLAAARKAYKRLR
jgi:hypothetical protein